MKDCKFKQLIIDSFNEYNNPERVHLESLLGCQITSRNFFGIIYGAISSDGFGDITDIVGYMDCMNPNMLYLKSKINDMEFQVYDYELVDYKIENDSIFIQLQNKSIKVKI